MNPNQQSNRLHLNFGFQNNPNFAAEQGRAFPTTPSTFPQPFPNSAGQQEIWGANQQASTGFNNQGYFMNNPYTSQMQNAANNLQSPTAAYSPGGYNDPTNRLAHQFSNQHLGGNSPRSQSPYGRQASPNPNRSRTGGAPGQQHYGHYLGAQMPSREQPSLADDEPPIKNPERFSTTITNRAKLQTELVGTFFKDNVERARDRNGR